MKKKKIFGSLIILSVFLMFLFVGYKMQSTKETQNDKDMSIYKENNVEYSSKVQQTNEVKNAKDNDGKKEIKAQIYGQIKKPGVYSLKNGDRIKDLIDLAGGFVDNANQYSVNGAKKVVDGDNIEIKSKEDKSNDNNNSNVKNSSSNSISSNENEKLDINSASEDDIVNKKIPGIGKGLAKKIVQYRDSNNGRIASKQELEKAIGPKRAEKLMEYIELN
ncbi:helix-hairpin-helix domain-containing protein [Clostridium sp.]|jgi:competence protein ComEA|uniref:helix-hairpin-helix domain-containing protein n=1 Tax=Clostridium sp. TaxID=1506 RepID=UPI002582ABEC|nr:helix-hairpin-helix domain-containing protein [Clostridium sp.]MDF2505621.1 uptake protein [Clostridium sp.]